MKEEEREEVLKKMRKEERERERQKVLKKMREDKIERKTTPLFLEQEFTGRKEGYAFMDGPDGRGYYHLQFNGARGSHQVEDGTAAEPPTPASRGGSKKRRSSKKRRLSKKTRRHRKC